jgi:cell fate (sporulation/competence/biofilm development) regulator YlbF (YheA/YmcA/DUF963 family)
LNINVVALLEKEQADFQKENLNNRRRIITPQTKPFNKPAIEERSVHQAAKELGERVRNSPEFRSYREALEQVKRDKDFQRLNAQAQTLRINSKWGFHTHKNHLTDLQNLELEIESLPVVQEYQRIEVEIRQLLKTLDEISGQLGVDYVNMVTGAR